MTHPDAPIDMTLRLWSDDVALGPLLKALGLASRTLHVRGEQAPLRNGAVRNAPRHVPIASS